MRRTLNLPTFCTMHFCYHFILLTSVTNTTLFDPPIPPRLPHLTPKQPVCRRTYSMDFSTMTMPSLDEYWRMNIMYCKNSCPTPSSSNVDSATEDVTAPCTIADYRNFIIWLVMAALRSRCGHYIFALWFLSIFYLLSFFVPRLISAAADWMSTILPHMVWPYCEFRMHPCKFQRVSLLVSVTYCTALQWWASSKLCGIESRAPPIFGRAAITLDIGPHF